ACSLRVPHHHEPRPGVERFAIAELACEHRRREVPLEHRPRLAVDLALLHLSERVVRAYRGVDDDELTTHAARLLDERGPLTVVQMAVEVRAEHAVEAAVRER